MKKGISLMMVCMLVIISISVNIFGKNLPEYITELTNYNIIKGDPDGDIRLEDNLTRAEAVTLIVRLCGTCSEDTENLENIFTDMDGHWAYSSVMTAKKIGIIKENEGLFMPEKNIKSEDFIIMVISLLGYKEAAELNGGNPTGYLMKAAQLGITNGLSLVTGSSITRDDAAKILFNSLDVPLMKMTGFEENSEYVIMNGENGLEYQTLRTAFSIKLK